jgi:hypothetical protein
MNTKSLIKLIKKAERESTEGRSRVEFGDDRNRWSRAVRAWVREFQQEARAESLPAFDRLFQTTNQRQG